MDSSHPSPVPAQSTTAAEAVAQTQDRVRLASVVAGVCAVIAVLSVLVVLGLGIRLSTVSPDDHLGRYGWAIGIWFGVSVLLACACGGFIATRSAGGHQVSHGVLNGGMVWIVAIPLILLFLCAGAAVLISSVSNFAGDTVDAIGSVAGGIAKDKGLLDVAGTIIALNHKGEQQQVKKEEQKIKQKEQAVVNEEEPHQPSADANRKAVEIAAHDGALVAWGMLCIMVLSLASAITGGVLGSWSRSRRP